MADTLRRGQQLQSGCLASREVQSKHHSQCIRYFEQDSTISAAFHELNGGKWRQYVSSYYIVLTW